MRWESIPGKERIRATSSVAEKNPAMEEVGGRTFVANTRNQEQMLSGSIGSKEKGGQCMRFPKYTKCEITLIHRYLRKLSRIKHNRPFGAFVISLSSE